MKKYLLLLIAACQGLAVMAQSPNYKMKITLKDGSKLSARTDEVEELTFSKLGKVKVELSERYKTSTSLAVNLDIDANVSRLKAVCVPASQTVSDIKGYIEKNATVDSKVSYKKSFDFLTPETDYMIYALAYDDNDLASEVSQLKMTTGKTEDDPFVVEAKNITTTTLDYVVTPKDNSIQYVVQTTGMDFYNDWCAGDNAGDVLQHFIAYWKAMGSMYGETWQQAIKYDAKTGVYDSEADYNTQTKLLWDADQVIITFGITNTGELVTPIQITKTKTLAPTPSSNKISLELKTNEWRNVVVSATTSNSDTYIVNVQRAELVDAHREAGDFVKWLLYSGTMDYANMGKSGSMDWEFTPNKGGEKYYAIGIGIDAYGAPTTEPVFLDFVLPEGSWGN